MKRVISTALCGLAAALVLFPVSQAAAQTVIASEDFDGGAVNLISGFDPMTDNLDGGGGDFYGVGNIDTWPQEDDMGNPLGVPFSAIDESGTVFVDDIEGIWSDLTSDRNNNFFCISDTREWTDDVNGDPTLPLVNSWTFDISSASGGPLQLCIDMGQMSDGFFGFSEGEIHFEYSIDGAPFETAILCQTFDSTGTGFEYRNMDLGTDSVEGLVCQATSPNTLVKLSAADGLPAADTICDKCPAAGDPGEGNIDTFVVDLNGTTGAVLEIRMTAYCSFEAFVFDNIVIKEVTGDDGVVVPDSVLVISGVNAGGDVGSLAETDDEDYTMQRSPQSIQAITEFEIKGVSPTETPSTLSFTIEDSVFARGAISRTIRMFDFQRRVFEDVDVRNASRFSDRSDTVELTGDLSRFIEPGTGCMITRIRHQSAVGRQNFAANVDQTIWTVGN